MAIDQEKVSKIINVLSHPIRREILMILREKGDITFTEMLKTLKIDTGKLSFHIRSLQPFIEQTKTGKYRLSRAGEDAVRVVRDIESWAELSVANPRRFQLPLASLELRVAAFLIDFGMMFTLAFLILIGFLFSSAVTSWFANYLNLLFVTLAFLWGYSTILEGFTGQTVGKRAIGIMAAKVDGKKINYEHAAVRNFGKILLPFDMLFGYTLKDPRYIRYFDKFAGTTVIDLRKHKYDSTAAYLSPSPLSSKQ